MNNEITVVTNFNEDVIEQSVEFPDQYLSLGSTSISRKAKDIIRIKEQHVIDALIALGWTPPPSSSKDK